MLSRARKELQEHDTVTVAFDSTGAVAGFWTVSAERRWRAERAADDSLNRLYDAVTRTATLTEFSVLDLTGFGQPLVEVSGVVEPRAEDLPRPGRMLAVSVDCEARRGETIFRGAGWVEADRFDESGRSPFDCHFLKHTREEWVRTRPNAFQARLRNRDSTVTGPWFRFTH